MKAKVLIPVVAIAALLIVAAIGLPNLFKAAVPFQSKDNTKLVFNQDETIVATATRGEGVLLWSTAGTKPPVRLAESDLAIPLCFQPDGQTLLGEQNGGLAYWLPNGARVGLGQNTKPARVRSNLREAAYCQDGSLLALHHSDKEKTLEIVSHYDTATILELKDVEWVCWCQQDIVAVGFESHLELWSVNGEKKLKTLDIGGGKEPAKIQGLCYHKERKALICVTQRGDVYHWLTTHDEIRRKSEPVRPSGNIGAIKHKSLRASGSDHLILSAIGDKEVKTWRFYDGGIEPMVTNTEPLRNHYEYYADLSPSAKWTTIYRPSEGIGHVLWLAPVTTDVKKK